MIIRANVTLDLSKDEVKEFNKLFKSVRIYYRQTLSILINRFDATYDIMTIEELEKEINKFRIYLKDEVKNIHPSYITNAIRLALRKFETYLIDNEKFEIKPLNYFKMITGFNFDFKNGILTLPDRKYKFKPSKKYSQTDKVVNIGLMIRKSGTSILGTMDSSKYKNEPEYNIKPEDKKPRKRRFTVDEVLPKWFIWNDDRFSFVKADESSVIYEKIINSKVVGYLLLDKCPNIRNELQIRLEEGRYQYTDRFIAFEKYF